MINFSRRKRLLTRTSKPPKMSSRRQFHRALRRHPAWPMVTEQAAARAKAHKEQEAARERLIKQQAAAQKQLRRVANRAWFHRLMRHNRTNVMGATQASGNKWLPNSWLHRLAMPVVSSVKSLGRHRGRAWCRSKLRKRVRRNRVLLVTLFVVGGLVALLTGISLGFPEWAPQGLLGGPQPPPARFGAATTYDGNNQNIVIFGGFVGTTSASNVGSIAGPPIITDNQTYLYSVSSGWGRRDTVHRPSPRGFAAMAYDGANRNVVLFGGAPYRAPDTAVSGETWIWDGQDWTLQNPPEPVPDPRRNAVMVYDAHRKVVMMFGGRGADGKPMNDTWTWNGSRWQIMPSAGAPSPRHSAAIAYDVCNAEAVMFGGIGDPVNNFVPQPRETWTWNGAKWTPESPLLSPTPARIGASMAYAHRSGRVLLYGGLTVTDAGVPTAAVDTAPWRWDGATNTWERMTIADLSIYNNVVLTIGLGDGKVRLGPPPPRAYASFTNLGDGYYGRSGEFNLFGGTPALDASSIHSGLGPNVPQVALGDHFNFSEAGVSGNGSFDTDAIFNEFAPDSVLARRCVNPVPLPPEEANQIDLRAEADKARTSREGMREIDQLPVLLGTDWPAANRNALNYSPTRPNPNYTSPPDCPNRTTILSGEGMATSGNTEDGKNSYLFTDQQRNRVYQFFVCDNNRGYNEQSINRPFVNNLLIEVHHGTTLKPIGKAVLRNVYPNANEVFQAGLIHDTDRGRFLFRTSYWNGSTTVNELVIIQQDLIEKGIDPVVRRIDLAGAPSIHSSNFFNHPKTGRAKMFFKIAGGGATVGPPPAQNTPPKLAQWDIEGRSQDWQVELTGCGLSGSPAMRFGDRIYTTCISNNRTAVVRIPMFEDPSVPAGERPGTPEPPYPGPVGGDIIGGDPQAERVVLRVQTQGGGTIWVFDGKASRWVGVVGITSNSRLSPSFSFDRETARVYIVFPDNAVSSPGLPLYYEQGGLLMVDTGLTPVPQPLKFPQFAAFSYNPTVSLPPGPGVPRRVFMRRERGDMKKYPNGETVKMPNEMFYRVIADDVPVSKVTDIAGLDTLTIPVPETPGKTEVSFDAEGSGYGIRLRSIGGIWSALRPFAQAYAGNLEFAENFFLGFARHTVPGCVFPDRELMAGWVPQARLSDLDALARSSGLEVDSNSKSDLEGPFSRCNPTANASNFPPSIKVVFDVLWPLKQMVESEGNKLASQGTTAETGKDADAKCEELKQPTLAGEVVVSDCTETPAGTISRGKDAAGNPTVRYDSTSSSWDSHFKEVECVGDALKTYQANVGNIYGSANCVQTKGKVEATAKGSATGAGPTSSITSSAGFSVAEGYSTVNVTREPNGRGVVVTSTAIAKGIQIPGLTIGYVTTTAVAWSNGRPGVNRASFTREICNVKPPLPVNPASFNDSAPSTGCLTENQQKALVKNWNDRWGINSKMYLPIPDPSFYQGSPGGYVAGVIKPAADETEDLLFAKDFQREVPGLVIEFVKDSEFQGNARQTLQLAAVRAVAGFGVQCNPDLIYSPQAKDCVALAFEDDPVIEEFFEEEETEDGAFNSYDDGSDGTWTPVEALGAPEGLALGKRIGNFIGNLPVFRRLPIRQMGEALLAGSVWMLLGMPLFLASRRFALNLARKS